MAEYRRSEIISGAFILLAVAVFALFAFKVGGLDLFWFARGEAREFEILLPNVKGLEKGAKVSFGGRRVGEIREIGLALPADVERFKERFRKVWGAECPELSGTDQITFMMMRVVFEIEAAQVRGSEGGPFRIHGPTAAVVLEQESLLGGHFLQLQPGEPKSWEDAKPIFGEGAPADDGPLPLRGRSADLLDVVRQEIRPTLTQLEKLLAKVNEEVLSKGNVARLETMLMELEGAVTNLRSFSEELPGVLENTERDLRTEVLEPMHTLLDNASETLDHLRKEVLDRVVAKAEEILGEGAETMAAARGVIDEADRVVAEAGPKAVAILENLRAGTAGLEKRLDALQARLDRVLERTDLLLAESRPELSETLQSLRRTAWETEMLMRKLRSNPALILFGDDEPDLGAKPLDASGLRRSGRARPYEQRDESGDGK